MSEQNDDSTTFLRQRRDLFVISALLLLIPIAEIKSGSCLSISQFGMSMTIGRPEIILSALWVIWAYWFVRYYQAYKKTNGGYFSKAMKDNTYQIAYKKFLKHSLKHSIKVFREYANNNKINFNNMMLYKAVVKTNEFKRFETSFSWEPNASIKGDPKSIILPEEKISYSGFSFIVMRIRALLSLVFNQMDFTEYYFPFIFGSFPAIYWLYTNKKLLISFFF